MTKRAHPRHWNVTAALEHRTIVALLYMAATLLLTHPLAWNLTTHLPLRSGDIWIGLWGFWWWKKALFELGTSPLETPFLYHPHGVSLAAHDHSPLNILATLPISLTVGTEAAYNVALLTGFVLSAFFTYLLVRDLTGEPRAAFLSGFIYAFTPMHFEETLCHINVSSVQFFPLLALFAVRTARDGGTRNALGLGLAVAANALVMWYWAIIGVVFAGVVHLGYLGVPDRRLLGRRLLEMGAAAAIAAALIAPLALPLLATVGSTDVRFHDLGVDPLFWFVPNEHHPFLGWIGAGLRERLVRVVAIDFHAYLGWIGTGLAVLAVARVDFGGSRRWFWAVLGVAFLVLSWGPHLTVAGVRIDSVPMPHAFFEDVPLLNRLRKASRFHLWALLPLSVLAGFALAGLFRASRARAAWLLGAFAILETLWVPFPLREINPHPYLQELARDPDAGAVLPVPFPVDFGYSQALHDQMIHGRPIPTGYVAYVPRGPLRTVLGNPFLRGLATTPPRYTALDLNVLRELEVRTVILHWDRARNARLRWMVDSEYGFYQRQDLRLFPGYPDAILARLSRDLRGAYGRPIYRDERIEVFRLPVETEPSSLSVD